MQKFVFLISALLVSYPYFSMGTASAQNSKKNSEANAQLKVEGTPGLQFLGFCVSKTDQSVRKFEGTVPTQITFDARVERCSVEKKEAKGALNLRFTYDEKTLYSNQVEGPTLGIQFVIPW